MARYYFITTMGCQMNEYDSDYLGQLLVNSGFLPAGNPEKADLVLVNTCAVRAKAEQKAFSLLGRMISLKKRKPDLILGLMGCIAQKEGPNLIKRFPALDLVLGTREIGRVPEIIKKIETDREKIVATNIDLKSSPPLNTDGYFKGRVKSYIAIMEGCNNFCSYCVVPYVRGREASRSPGEILKEAEYLISQGVKEITLLGQNVNSYSWGKEKEFGFPLLLRGLSKLDGLARIRFTTSHPKDLSDELIHCFGELDNLCPHIHLPVQSGSNRILKLMNRGYTRERYMKLIERLRAVRHDAAITSDVIVGFPGESEDDFKITLDLIREVKFDGIFSFKYSDRKGTVAEKMNMKINEDIKSSRLTSLQSIQKEITLKKNKTEQGMEVEILVEGDSKRGGQLMGRTGTNKIVNFIGNNNLIGKLIKVKINHSFVNSLLGELIKP